MLKERMKGISTLGCSTIILLVVGVILGIGFSMRFFISYVQAIIPENVITTGLVVGCVLVGLSMAAIALGLAGVTKKKNGEIHISSPVWVDIVKGIGIVLCTLTLMIQMCSPVETWSASLINSGLVLIFAIGCGVFVYKLKKDINDKMVIADDFISVDKEMSNETLVIKREDILEIKTFEFRSRDTSYFISFKYRKIEDNKEKDEVFIVEPDDDLNVDRDVIEKHLKEKGYIVINE
jgi:hypothetical protein